jgi:hypothetical protein
MPSPDPGGNIDGGANGFCGNGSRSLRPISKGLFGGPVPRGPSKPIGGTIGCGLAGGGLREEDGVPAELVDTSASSIYPSFRKPGMIFCTIASLCWEMRSATRFEDMKPCTSGRSEDSILYGKKEGDVKSSVAISRVDTLSLYLKHESLKVLSFMKTYFKRNCVNKRAPSKTDYFDQEFKATLVMFISERVKPRCVFIPIRRQDIIRAR